jgi:hypothetical protein
MSDACASIRAEIRHSELEGRDGQKRDRHQHHEGEAHDEAAAPHRFLL